MLLLSINKSLLKIVFIVFAHFLFFFSIFFGCSEDTNNSYSTEKASSKQTEEKKDDNEKEEKISIPKNPNDNNSLKYDPLFKDQWYLKNTRQIEGEIVRDINIEKVWQKGYLGQGMFIGVLDELVDNTHPDLKDNLPNGNVISYTKGIYPQRSHGTAVASIISAKDNGVGIQGVAPRAILYSFGITENLSSMNSQEETDLFVSNNLINALEKKLHQKIAVYNGSFSILDGWFAYDKMKEIRKKIDLLTKEGFYGKGSLLVAAGGSVMHAIASALEQSHAVIMVNGINRLGQIFSNRSPNVWLAAFSASQFDNGKGMKIIAANNVYKKNKKKYTGFGGSSAATPMVSGAIALLRQAYPKLTWRDVKLILAESANKLNKMEYKVSGFMIHDKKKEQKYNRRIGFGLLDVANAFNIAEKWQLLPPMKVFNSVVQQQRLAVKADDIFRESSLIIKNSGIRYIESLQIKIVVEKEEEKNLIFNDLFLHLVSPDNKRRKIYHDEGKNFYIMRLAKNNNTIFTTMNAFLGSSRVDGTWKLKVKLGKGTKITAIKSWNLIIRGH